MYCYFAVISALFWTRPTVFSNATHTRNLTEWRNLARRSLVTITVTLILCCWLDNRQFMYVWHLKNARMLQDRWYYCKSSLITINLINCIIYVPKGREFKKTKIKFKKKIEEKFAILSNCIAIRIAWLVSWYIDASMNRAATTPNPPHMANKPSKICRINPRKWVK